MEAATIILQHPVCLSSHPLCSVFLKMSVVCFKPCKQQDNASSAEGDWILLSSWVLIRSKGMLFSRTGWNFHPGCLTKIQLCLLSRRGEQKHNHPFALQSHRGYQEAAGVSWGPSTTRQLQVAHCPQNHSPRKQQSYYPIPLTFEIILLKFNTGSAHNSSEAWRPEKTGEAWKQPTRQTLQGHIPCSLTAGDCRCKWCY